MADPWQGAIDQIPPSNTGCVQGHFFYSGLRLDGVGQCSATKTSALEVLGQQVRIQAGIRGGSQIKGARHVAPDQKTGRAAPARNRSNPPHGLHQIGGVPVGKGGKQPRLRQFLQHVERVVAVLIYSAGKAAQTGLGNLFDPAGHIITTVVPGHGRGFWREVGHRV